MVKSNIKDVARSIRARLLNHAKQQNDNFNTVMAQYVLQRLLYRLSISQYADNFLLKGAWLFVVWSNALHRPTKDIDLLGLGNNDLDELLAIFKFIASVAVDEPDGVFFIIDSFNVTQIKEDDHYQGVRITGLATLDKAKIPLQVDIGFGDAVTPAAVEASLPCLLDMAEPKLRVYPAYTVVAEKFQAMVMLGLVNSRMKDFYDIGVIAHTIALDGAILLQAVKATFDRRETVVSTEPLYVFSDEFKQDKAKQTQWKAFLNKNNLNNKTEFSHIVGEVQRLLEPVYQCIAEQQLFQLQWSPEEFQWKG